MKDEAAAEKKLDAAITAIKLNDQVQNVTADPKGERIIKNILNLKSGNNGTKVVPDDTSLMFYDDGGESGKESKNFDGTITFAPVSPGYGIKLTAKNWTLVYGDKFRCLMAQRPRRLQTRNSTLTTNWTSSFRSQQMANLPSITRQDPT